MSVFQRFFRSRTDGERVIGTYLYPICLLGEPDWENPDSPVQVVASATVDDHEVLVTRMGGLFVRPPEELSNPYEQPADSPLADDLQAKMAFEEKATQAFNKVICELCLLGVISQPTSPVHIEFGQLIEGHALVVVGSGGREVYTERTIGPNAAVLQGTWRTWPMRPEAALAGAVQPRRSDKLANISLTLPLFVASAYSLFSQRQVNAAISDSWVVCEQIVNHWWGSHLEGIHDEKRRQRLSDGRAYTAAIKIEVLQTARVIGDELSEALNKARNHRNNLLHSAKMSLPAAKESMNAMKVALEHVLGEEVAEPSVSTGVTW